MGRLSPEVLAVNGDPRLITALQAG
jgi:hypothetical protein